MFIRTAWLCRLVELRVQCTSRYTQYENTTPYKAPGLCYKFQPRNTPHVHVAHRTHTHQQQPGVVHIHHNWQASCQSSGWPRKRQLALHRHGDGCLGVGGVLRSPQLSDALHLSVEVHSLQQVERELVIPPLLLLAWAFFKRSLLKDKASITLR